MPMSILHKHTVLTVSLFHFNNEIVDDFVSIKSLKIHNVNNFCINAYYNWTIEPDLSTF